ncbi:hypothetical protein, partial [Chelativorans composti]
AGHCHLAWFCAAAWPDFAPPLTLVSFYAIAGKGQIVSKFQGQFVKRNAITTDHATVIMTETVERDRRATDLLDIADIDHKWDVLRARSQISVAS